MASHSHSLYLLFAAKNSMVNLPDRDPSDPTESNPKDAHFFQFEEDFVTSLRCIPMKVRLKLDSCGIKLRLADWHQFSQAERQTLVTLPCENEATADIYRSQLQALVIQHTGQAAPTLAVDPHPPWLTITEIPESVQAKAGELRVSLSLDQWRRLTPSQRFALIKLSRPSHENRNFGPALQEFGLG